MKDYVIEKINTRDYNRFLLCLTFESIFEYLPEIEVSPDMVNFSGKVLIDQLLITGNGRNRFVSCNFENGKLDVSTAENVTPDDSLRKLSVEFLHNNYNYVKHSILTDSQKKYIKEGVVF